MIINKNNRYKSKIYNTEQYNIFKKDIEKKMNLFLKNEKLTQNEYDELFGILLNVQNVTYNSIIFYKFDWK